jgi:hypothetical protein
MSIGFNELVEYSISGKTAMLKIERLLKQLRRGKTEDFADELDEDVDIIDVLSPIAPGDAINTLKEKLRTSEIELGHLRQDRVNKAHIEEMRKIVLGLDKKTEVMWETMVGIDEKTTAILTNITNIIKKIEDNADEQRFSLQVIFDELSRHKESITDPQLLSMIENILAEVRVGNSKSFSDILLQIYSVAGSNASFISLALMIQDILQKIPM